NSYGKDLSEGSFPDLLRLLDQTGIERIRFMTSHPKDLSDALIDVMASSRHVLPQFHLPVQSGDDEILRKMNRHYTREAYMNKVRKLRAAVPGIGLTTDLIVAFPGETEAQFEHTLELVEEVGYDSAFTFIYSPRTGTAAARMPDQIPQEVASERIQRLIALQEECQRNVMRRFLGQKESVLVEGLSRRCDTQVSGRGIHGLSVTLPGDSSDVGQIVEVTVTDIKQNTLLASRMESEDRAT
ncbi:MAG: MiaB/RimO family radical SAM methylthiotransferase, partial [Clostridia bacterium]|nr:MiaB/RimO family radical SAM methylthiotransferase [Clostridia bacterium]